MTRPLFGLPGFLPLAPHNCYMRHNYWSLPAQRLTFGATRIQDNRARGLDNRRRRIKQKALCNYLREKEKKLRAHLFNDGLLLWSSQKMSTTFASVSFVYVGFVADLFVVLCENMLTRLALCWADMLRIRRIPHPHPLSFHRQTVANLCLILADRIQKSKINNSEWERKEQPKTHRNRSPKRA